MRTSCSLGPRRKLIFKDSTLQLPSQVHLHSIPPSVTAQLQAITDEAGHSSQQSLHSWPQVKHPLCDVCWHTCSAACNPTNDARLPCGHRPLATTHNRVDPHWQSGCHSLSGHRGKKACQAVTAVLSSTHRHIPQVAASCMAANYNTSGQLKQPTVRLG